MPGRRGIARRPGWMHGRQRVLGWFALGVTGLCAVGSGCQVVAAQRDRRRFPPPGRMVDVGGFRLHMDVRGDDRGAPTVVLEAGLGSFSPNWHWAHTELAKTLRVVAYDRAGLGWSDPSPAPRDAESMATELHAALHRADIGGPYVLAGHSFGGLVVRAFADRYPTETAGLVLVDASHPDQWARWPVRHADRMLEISQRVTAAAARVGLLRVVDLSAAVSAGLPARQAAELRARTALPTTSVTEAVQMKAWAQNRRHLHEAQPLADLPLAVIGVGVQPFGGPTLTALQDELPGLSTNSARRIIAAATHESLVANRVHATPVTDAIRAVVDAAAGGRVETAWTARES